MYLLDWDENYFVDDEDWSSESRCDGLGVGLGLLNVFNIFKKNFVLMVYIVKFKYEVVIESGGGGVLWLVVVIFVVVVVVVLVFFCR